MVLQMSEELQLPHGDLVGEPVTFHDDKKIAFILQNVVRELDGSWNEKSRVYNIYLCLYQFGAGKSSVEFR